MRLPYGQVRLTGWGPARAVRAYTLRTMSGENDLRTLLSRMRPQLNAGRYVFTTDAGGTAGHGASELPPGVTPVATVAEEEGVTRVIRLEDAEAAGLPYDYVAGWITLRVHSALGAVGLTAAVAGKLASADLSCNVIAGFYHDHLFVPYERAAEAVLLIEELAGGPR